MTKGELHIFLLASAGLCAIMTVFNLVRARKRGWTAYLLSTAFLLLGGLALLVRAEAPSILIQAGSVVLFLMLVADFIVRAAKPPARKKR